MNDYYYVKLFFIFVTVWGVLYFGEPDLIDMIVKLVDSMAYVKDCQPID